MEEADGIGPDLGIGGGSAHEGRDFDDVRGVGDHGALGEELFEAHGNHGSADGGCENIVVDVVPGLGFSDAGGAPAVHSGSPTIAAPAGSSSSGAPSGSSSGVVAPAGSGSSSGAAAGSGPPPPPPPPMPPPAGGDENIAWHLPGGGAISWYRYQGFVATCPRRHAHGRCRITRTHKAAAMGSSDYLRTSGAQGRPLGMMYCWLENHAQFDDKLSHHLYKPLCGDRRAARRLLIEMAQGGNLTVGRLLGKERPLADGEPDENDYCL
eukprot:4090263-Pyramimonas_sp.AAC.1